MFLPSPPFDNELLCVERTLVSHIGHCTGLNSQRSTAVLLLMPERKVCVKPECVLGKHCNIIESVSRTTLKCTDAGGSLVGNTPTVSYHISADTPMLASRKIQGCTG